MEVIQLKELEEYGKSTDSITWEIIYISINYIDTKITKGNCKNKTCFSDATL